LSNISEEGLSTKNVKQIYVTCDSGTVVEISIPNKEENLDQIGTKLKISSVFRDVCPQEYKKNCNIGICSFSFIKPENKIQITCLTPSKDGKSIFVADNVGNLKQISLNQDTVIQKEYKKVARSEIIALCSSNSESNDFDSNDDCLFVATKDGYVNKVTFNANNNKSFTSKKIWFNSSFNKPDFLSWSSLANYVIPQHCMIISHDQKKIWVCNSGCRGSFLSSIGTANKDQFSINYHLKITGITSLIEGKKKDIFIGNSNGELYKIGCNLLDRKEAEVYKHNKTKFDVDLRNNEHVLFLGKVHKNTINSIRITTKMDHLITICTKENEIKIGYIVTDTYRLVRLLRCSQLENNLQCIHLVNICNEDCLFLADDI